MASRFFKNIKERGCREYHDNLTRKLNKMLLEDLQRGTVEKFNAVLSLALNLGLLAPYDERNSLDENRLIASRWKTKQESLQNVAKTVDAGKEKV